MRIIFKHFVYHTPLNLPVFPARGSTFGFSRRMVMDILTNIKGHYRGQYKQIFAGIRGIV